MGEGKPPRTSGVGHVTMWKRHDPSPTYIGSRTAIGNGTESRITVAHTHGSHVTRMGVCWDTNTRVDVTLPRREVFLWLMPSVAGCRCSARNCVAAVRCVSICSAVKHQCMYCTCTWRTLFNHGRSVCGLKAWLPPAIFHQPGPWDSYGVFYVARAWS